MNQDFEKWGKDVKIVIEDAINTKDFSQLNQTITNTVNNAIKEVQKGMHNSGQAIYVNPNDERKAIRKPAPRPKDLFANTTGTKVGGTALTLVGAVLSGGLGLVVIVLLLIMLLSGNIGAGTQIGLSILIPFLGVSSFMTYAGNRMLSSSKRFQKYIGILRGRTYCNIEELAEGSRKKASFVLKDIKRMIDKGWFIEGHLDESETCLIASNETYHEYQMIKKERQEQKVIEQKEEQKEVLTQNVQKVIEEGNRYIEKIRKSNDAIPGIEISNKIYYMETLVQKIFERVKACPDTIDDIEKLMEYYLPTTIKLLDAYEQLDKQPVQGENIKSSKKEIEDTLDTLNIAFEKLLDSLFEDVAWDVSSDISVLNTMLAQEGLTNHDFRGGEK